MGRSKKMLITTLYVLVESALLLLIKLLEYSVPYVITQRLMFSAIAINFAVIAFFYIFRKSVKERTRFPFAAVFWAMLCTLLADTFLVLINDYYVVGVILFCAVQTLYALHLGISLKQAILRFSLFAALLLVLLLAERLDLLSGFSAFSMAMLSVNVVMVWRNYRKDQQMAGLLFALGLTLFFFCDANVGIMNASAAGTTINAVSAWLIWVFYIPSQVLITLSFILNPQIEGKPPFEEVS